MSSTTLKDIDLHQREIADLTRQLYNAYNKIREMQEELKELKQLLDQRLPADQ